MKDRIVTIVTFAILNVSFCNENLFVFFHLYGPHTPLAVNQ